ncbi:hypothetical protein JYK14_24455 [Siccirubricoccus sp. KC 17139]|uniref:Uncharacterized protein n=1 Tax=Siccirubricoccus soli TaxID=2899147 RepID=A0ABT1DBH1_9PROT|nr:hypothetical protein [Siccirubricoccus soli]MCO6419287.1 hypothetical protein [Siccirubricoccus soli]MCP2685422.1 hypothetical protein [Siccirubricoccus soli]
MTDLVTAPAPPASEGRGAWVLAMFGVRGRDRVVPPEAIRLTPASAAAIIKLEADCVTVFARLPDGSEYRVDYYPVERLAASLVRRRDDTGAG